MKKVACALLISVNLISSAFAAKNTAVVRSLDAAKTVVSTTPNTTTKSIDTNIEAAVESAIDQVASTTTNPEALNILAWFKERPKTTLALGLAATVLTTDTLYHWLTLKTTDENGVTWHDDEQPTVWGTSWTNNYLVSPVKNMPGKCVGYTIALAAAVFAVLDLQKEENDSYLKQAWTCVTSWIAETEAAIEEDIAVINTIVDITSSDKKATPAA